MEENRFEQEEMNNMEPTAIPTPTVPTTMTEVRKIPFVDLVQMIFCGLGMLTGLIVTFVSIAIDEYAEYVSSVTFGADFYTEIHSATAAAANNASDIISVIEAFKIVPITLGIFMFLSFALKLCDFIKKHIQA